MTIPLTADAVPVDLERFRRADLTRDPFSFVVVPEFVPRAIAEAAAAALTTTPRARTRPIDGVRRSLIVNYVKPEWRARRELAFPDQPAVSRNGV